MATVVTQRKPYVRKPREERLSAIMQTAQQMFIDQGYEATSMADIAAAVGIVEGTIYRFFDTKRELLIRVLEEWFAEVMADYDRQLAGVRGLRNRLRFLIWHHLRTLFEYPELCRLLVHHIRTDPDYAQTSIYQLNRDYTRHTLDIVQEGVAAGEYRDDIPPRLVRDMIYGGSEYYTWGFIEGLGREFPVDETADQMTNLIDRALRRDVSWSAPDDPVAQRLEGAAGRLEAAAERIDSALKQRLDHKL